MSDSRRVSRLGRIMLVSLFRNVVHGSTSVEAAEMEINLWFAPHELVDYHPCTEEWIYEEI